MKSKIFLIMENVFRFEEFVGLIRHNMDSQNLSIKAAAEEIGISRSALSRLLSGGTIEPSLSMLLLVCDWIGISPAVFFGEEGDKMYGNWALVRIPEGWSAADIIRPVTSLALESNNPNNIHHFPKEAGEVL